MSRILTGCARHFLVTLRLNGRSLQSLVYGYLVPVFFLLAFASVFRGELPLLHHQMGQLLTVTILGGACFGLPTALVAERERGVWRRYRLLPVPVGGLIASTLLARLIIVGSAVAMQLFLARWFYHTPLPAYPSEMIVAFLFVGFAFLGLGLLVASLADDVPAVQALGQCLFLPMIMIGGVGVPLEVLPNWARTLSGFMPGRYAVDLIQRCFTSPQGLQGAGFDCLALVAAGAAAGIVGLKMFRWENGRKAGRAAWCFAAAALAIWAAVGAAAAASGCLAPTLNETSTWEALTEAQISSIPFDGLPGDNELVTRLSPPFPGHVLPATVRSFAESLRTWPPVHLEDPEQNVRNLLSVAAAADIGADLREAEIGRLIFEELQARYGRDALTRLLAWVILRPDDGSVLTQVPHLRYRRQLNEAVVRERCALYARKYLGRLLGRLPD